MKRLLFFLLGAFLLVDIGLAFYYLNPRTANNVIKQVPDRSIKVSSAVPSLEGSLTNKAYLDKKLNELKFWDTRTVNFFRRNRKVSVNHLEFILTDKPQEWGIVSPTGEPKDALLSYGQEFDANSETMKIIVQVDPKFEPKTPLGERYSTSILMALFDLTQEYPRKSLEEYGKNFERFLTDYYANPSTNSFVIAKQK